MAKLIEFYVPSSFRKQTKWTPVEQRGKVIEFCPADQRTTRSLTQPPERPAPGDFAAWAAWAVRRNG